jgi:hypothetical protein
MFLSRAAKAVRRLLERSLPTGHGLAAANSRFSLVGYLFAAPFPARIESATK